MRAGRSAPFDKFNRMLDVTHSVKNSHGHFALFSDNYNLEPFRA